jgi:hypothetical protein
MSNQVANITLSINVNDTSVLDQLIEAINYTLYEELSEMCNIEDENAPRPFEVTSAVLNTEQGQEDITNIFQNG